MSAALIRPGATAADDVRGGRVVAGSVTVAELGEEPDMASTLTRPRQGAVIAGVCAGLAERFGWSPFAVRLVFLLSCLLPGPQFVVYLVLWVIMPRRPY